MEKIEGSIILYLFNNQANGFSIAKIECKDTKEVISGYFPILPKDTLFSFTGEYVVHPKYGKQFKVESYNRVLDNEEGLVTYLSSNLFTGIGEKTARRIYEFLGIDAIKKIIENKDVLDLVEGFPKKKKEQFQNELINNQYIEDLLIKLYEYDITSKTAMKLYGKYGMDTLKIINTNPYQIIEDIEGFGFLKADQLAMKLGFLIDDPLRISQALLFVLQQMAFKYGFTYTTKDFLIEEAEVFLKLHDNEKIINALDELIKNKKVISEDDRVSLKALYFSELAIGNKVREFIAKEDKSYDSLTINKAIELIEFQDNIKYTVKQKEAIISAVKSPFSIITGGPGTGKTTIVKGIIKLYAFLNKLDLNNIEKLKSIGLMAPTGRASKRLMETTLLQARTIHRTLGYNYDGEFAYNEENRLDYSFIIVDECSMVDVFLGKALLTAVKDDAQIVFVGDSFQLPSVGPGNLLFDLINSKLINVITLNEIHRQASDSAIIKLSHAVKKGVITWDLMDSSEDLSFVSAHKEEIIKYIEKIIDYLLKNGYSLLNDIEILAPMYKGDIGIDVINDFIQKKYNPQTKLIKYGFKEFRENDKVLQLQNNPLKGVMNGDIGIIKSIVTSKEDDTYILVDYDGNLIMYKANELDEITLAYAISIHKSQGNEYKAVIMPVTKAYYIMLKRKLLYTGITRAKERLYLVGDLDAFKMGVNNHDDIRLTNLCKMLVNKKEYKKMILDESIPFDYLGEYDMENITPYDFLDIENDK